MPDLVLDYHRLRTPIDHPDDSITRLKLSESNFNTFWFLALKYGFYHHENPVSDHTYTLINKVFVDFSAIYVYRDGMRVPIRHQYPTWNNTYAHELSISLSTLDHSLSKWIAGSITRVGAEAVDLSNYNYLFGIDVVGSTFKLYRSWVNAYTISSATPKVVITDTTYTSGYTGIGHTYGSEHARPVIAVFMPPFSTPMPSALAVVEYPVTGSGKPEDPIRPDMPQELVEIDPRSLPPDEASAVQHNPKGSNGMPLVNRLAITWGAIDYRNEPTMVVAIYPSAPSYIRGDSINRHISYARGKGLLAHAGPFTLDRARDVYGRLKAMRNDMLITVNELAYQLIGTDELEVDAVADFYEREVINLGRIDPSKIPNFDAIIDMWINRSISLKRKNALNKLLLVKKK